MSKEHTPTPWRLHPFYSTTTQKMDKLALRCVGKSMTGRDWTAYVESEDGTTVLQTDGATEEEAIANAQIVLRTVNSHEALVEACKKAKTCASLNSDVRALIDAALALADKDS